MPKNPQKMRENVVSQVVAAVKFYQQANFSIHQKHNTQCR